MGERMSKRIRFIVKVELFGVAEDDEPRDEVISRIALEAEQRINAVGDIRAHLELDPVCSWCQRRIE
jgi:hypothetical protein